MTRPHAHENQSFLKEDLPVEIADSDLRDALCRSSWVSVV